MANLELEGTIKNLLPKQSGLSANGKWEKQDFILEYEEGKYLTPVCLTAFGTDKVAELAKFKVGDKVKVSLNLRGREYNGRWYNDIRAWRIVPLETTPVPEPAPAPSAGDIPAPSLDDMPGEDSFGDDLPF